MNNTTSNAGEKVNPNRPYAQLDDYESSGRCFVIVLAPNPEGGQTCISHAPFSKQPNFKTISEARTFAKSFGVADEDIDLRSHPRAYITAQTQYLS